MLTTISRSRRERPLDLVGLLLECHERIRFFVRLAQEAGARSDVSEQETIEACLQVERYLIEALPLHIADEEQSILPRLRVCSPVIAEALQKMEAQHAKHMPKIDALLQASRDVRESPRDSERRASLLAAALDLEHEFVEHLTFEETTLFPAIRAHMRAEVQEQVVSELRQRRAPTFAKDRPRTE